MALRVGFYRAKNIVFYLGLWTNTSNLYVTLPFIASLQVRVRRSGPDPEETMELEKIRTMEESAYDVDTVRSEQNGRDFADDIFKFWKKMSEFLLLFHWGLFLCVQGTLLLTWFNLNPSINKYSHTH